MSAIQFTSNFDSGNGILQSCVGNSLVVNIKDDVHTKNENKTFKQWFHFRLSNVKDAPLNIEIPNAGACFVPTAWINYHVCASYDRKTWFRVPCTYDAAAGSLRWNVVPTSSQIYFAYFPPYSREQHLDLIAWAGNNGGTISTIGNSLQGREIDMITIGTGPQKVWFIGRQHPGEPQGEWFIDGLLRRLLNARDATSRHLLQDATFRIVPNINPDGSTLGHLRTNAAGANLNREWTSKDDYVAPTMENSPEVFQFLQLIDSIGCDCFVDCHGDEELPYCFVSGSEGCSVYGPALEVQQRTLLQEMRKADPNFQIGHGYSIDKPNTANYRLASKQISERLKCLAVTLEMPYKDVIDCRDQPATFLDVEAVNFGANMLSAVAAILPVIRANPIK